MKICFFVFSLSQLNIGIVRLTSCEARKELEGLRGLRNEKQAGETEKAKSRRNGARREGRAGETREAKSHRSGARREGRARE